MRRKYCVSLLFFLMSCLAGCGASDQPLPLDTKVAQTSLEKTLQAWVDGKKPEDIKPEIIAGDVAWTKGKKLISFEILEEDQKQVGSNLHIRVKRKFSVDGKETESQALYIVGTSPVITVFAE